jgi:beta-galactosidase
MSAEIKDYHGTPTLFLDGKPIFDGMMWGSPPTPEGYPLKECARLYGEAGIHIFAFDIGTYGTPSDWCGPRPGVEGTYDFATLQPRFERVIQVDPDARFHLRVHLEAPAWWQKLYPEECELTSDGRRLCQSFASKTWRLQAKAYLRALVAHFDSIGMSERIVAYQTGAGGTGEWVKAAAMAGDTIDYSQPMQDHYRNWLRSHYGNDETLFRKVWAAPNVTFESAEVPTAEAQLKTRQYTFRDPRSEQNVIDFFRCLAELCGDLVIDFCTTVKEAAGRQTLTGAFYGYLMELAWNSSFFADGYKSEYSGYQRSGHLELGKVLQSPNVDFLVSPYSYGFRGIGGEEIGRAHV